MLIGWSYLHVAALASSPILRGGFHSLRLFCASTPWKEKLRGLELSQSSSPPPPMRVSDHAQSMAAKKLFSRPRHPSLCFRHAVRKKTFLSFYLRCSSPSSVSQLFFFVCLPCRFSFWPFCAWAATEVHSPPNLCCVQKNFLTEKHATCLRQVSYKNDFWR